MTVNLKSFKFSYSFCHCIMHNEIEQQSSGAPIYTHTHAQKPKLEKIK